MILHDHTEGLELGNQLTFLFRGHYLRSRC